MKEKLMNWKRLITLSLLIVLSLLAACSQTPGITPTPMTPIVTPTPTGAYSSYQLEYLLIAKYTDLFWWDPDFYPIGRPEEPNAKEQFPTIRANKDEFAAIIQHLGLPDKAGYNDAEMLAIYREYKKLNRAVQITPSGTAYTYTLRIGENQGNAVEGTITPAGKITELKRETSSNIWPICLVRGTLIDTPEGQVPVEELTVGSTVWSFDVSGNRFASPIIETSSTPIPPDFQVVRITLTDGRTVTTSPNHPSAEGKALRDYRVGDMLDGAPILNVEYVEYDGGATFDILPAGTTGYYRANGILLGSTLRY
jgi:hypothetical protein